MLVVPDAYRVYARQTSPRPMCDSACNQDTNPTSHLPDQVLMTRLATALDRDTVDTYFEEIFKRYRERVTSWCYKTTKDRDRALDLTQEVFLKAFRNVRTFRGDSQLSTWLYVIARNHCLNAVKKRRTEPDDRAIRQYAPLLAVTDDVHSTLEHVQAYQQVHRFLCSILTPMEVRILTLHYVHDLTLPAITRHLLLPNPSGAKAYVVSARRKLKAAVQNYTLNRDTVAAHLVKSALLRRSAAD